MNRLPSFLAARPSDVEYAVDPVQLADRGGMGRALPRHLRVRQRFLEDSNVSDRQRRVSSSVEALFGAIECFLFRFNSCLGR